LYSYTVEVTGTQASVQAPAVPGACAAKFRAMIGGIKRMQHDGIRKDVDGGWDGWGAGTVGTVP